MSGARLNLGTRVVPYRPEIDGIRGIAVLLVVLFHFSTPGFAGGFVGVDIFFVISGFLIGSILWHEYNSTGTISLMLFYSRRARRLMPAYIVMAFFSTVIAYFILLPADLKEFGKTAIVSTAYVSNIYFFYKTGYFDVQSHEKPLLHTWSLSVEEQFYLCFPLAILLLRSSRLRITTLLSILMVLSFGLCLYITGRSQPKAFFLFPFRAWELLAGVLLAIYGLQAGETWRGRASISWIGAALLCGAVIFIEPSQDFPGYQAAVPVMGTVLIILNGKDENFINRLLSTPVLVLVGLMSYSLYLWHWPVVTLAMYYRGSFSGPIEAALWLSVAFAVAWLSWRLVEVRTRSADVVPTRPFVAGATIATVVLLISGGMLYIKDGLPERFEPSVAPHIAASQDFIQDWSRCHLPSSGPLEGFEVCPIGPSDREPDFLAWGDSHLRAFKEGLDLAAWESGSSGLLVWRAGCPPILGLLKRESASTPLEDLSCQMSNAKLRDIIPRLITIKKVLLIGRWAYYAEGKGVGKDAHNTVTLLPEPGSLHNADFSQSTLFADAVMSTVQYLAGHRLEVFVLRQVPEIPNYDSRQVARLMFHSKRIPNSNLEDLLSVPRSVLTQRSATAEEPFVKLADEGKIVFLDTWDKLCGPEACSAMRDSQSFYFDNNHITNAAARALRTVFVPVLTRFEEPYKKDSGLIPVHGISDASESDR